MSWRAVPFTVLLVVLLLAPGVAACISPYGFEDFEPTPLVAPGTGGDVPPVDVSASSVDDMFPELVSYNGDLLAFWIKSTGTTVVTESLMSRAMNGTQWGPLMAINSPDPTNLTREGELIRVAGFDVAVHDGLLYAVWSTPDPDVTEGSDNDLVYRTFDGTTWGPILEVPSPDDGAEDVLPSIASTRYGLMVAWTTNSAVISDGPDQDIVVTHLGPGSDGAVVEVTPAGDSDNDFLPRAIGTPLGSHVVWHTRVVREVPGHRGLETGMAVSGRWTWSGVWHDIEDYTGGTSGEDVWIDLMWDGHRLCMVWQRGGADLGYDATTIMFRDWDLEGFGPVQDLAVRQGNANNGKPRLAMVEGNVSVYWHTDDDGVTVGSTYDLVHRVSQGGGHWSPLEPFVADDTRDLLNMATVEHDGGVWAAWMANVTYDVPVIGGTTEVWDVVVGPIVVGRDPADALVVTPRWVRETKAWGPDDRIVFSVTERGVPRGDVPLTVTVYDPKGRVEAVLQGTTGQGGETSFDHVMEAHGEYGLEVVVEGRVLGTMALRVSPPPEGQMGNLGLTLGLLAGFVMALTVTGTAFIRRRGVVDATAGAGGEQGFIKPMWSFRMVSRVLTKVVRSAKLQGWLQMPMFLFFVVSIYIGFFGTQDPTQNFTTMIGWVYYLPGMLILYAFFGRLWCYFEACGFMDTWAKKLAPRREWKQWPYWLTGLWVAFVLLLAGFWVEIVFSIDLYPWAVATFMLAILLLNFFVSVTFGKRTYCRFVCRDGVIEELIARFSLFKIGVQTRADTTKRGGACIWKEGEKRPGYCSMCFSCVQNNPDVQEASVVPMLRDYGKDVYEPKKVHRDEAWAALLLMGISIPYMLVLTRAWWVDLTDVAFAMEPSMGALGLAAVGVGLAVGTWLFDRWAFARWSGWFTAPRRALIVLLQALLLALYVAAAFGGGVGRLVALRSLIVLASFTVPFIIVLAGEHLVVRLTGNSLGEPAGRLLNRYALVFIPVFVGVLIARNLPIVAMWGWAAWDIFWGTLSNFPAGPGPVTAQPFIPPETFYTLGVMALAFGLFLGAYTALQISRRLYKD
ncbi:MAG: hypothetical protein JSW25_08565, partial [Thermoplasmata archaeon]